MSTEANARRDTTYWDPISFVGQIDGLNTIYFSEFFLLRKDENCKKYYPQG